MRKKDIMKDLLPNMYVKILEQSTSRIQADIEGVFSFYMEQFQTSLDKETLLKEMFISTFSEMAVPAIEPWVNTLGEEHL